MKQICVRRPLRLGARRGQKHNRQSGKRSLSSLIGWPRVVLPCPYAKAIQVEHKEWKEGKYDWLATTSFTAIRECGSQRLPEII
jgi:hypothetical protein